MKLINPSSSTSSVSRKSSLAAKWLSRALGFSGPGTSSFRRTALSRVAVLGLLSCGWLYQEAMAQDNLVFMKIEGVKGSVSDRYHPDAMEAFGFTLGVEQPGFHDGFMATGTGGSAALVKPKFNVVSVTKRVDSSSPTLFAACVSGQRFSQVTLSVAKAGQTQVDSVKIILTGVTIVKVGNDTQAGAPNGLVYETLSLSYTKIQWVMAATSSTGPVSGVFDLNAGRPF